MIEEPPIVVATRKELAYLLCQAAELEHALMVEYLYAAFSLKTTADDGVTEDQLARVNHWRKEILAVAAEEMLHWTLVNNLLTAIGSAPYVSRPHLPHQAAGYPAGVQLALVPFGERSLRHFLYLERPEGMVMSDAEGFEARGPALPMMAETDIAIFGQEWSTQGHLYRSIERAIEDMAATLGEDGTFIGPPEAQITKELLGWPQLVPVTDSATAASAIEGIVAQGEGARGDWSQAHYGRFLAVLEEYMEMRSVDPSFDPVHPVLGAGVRPADGVTPEVFITDAGTAAASDLFNASYDLLLQLLSRLFAGLGETFDEKRTLIGVAVGMMFDVIKPLGLALSTMPVGAEHPGATAGANFQLFYRSNFLLPHRHAAWLRFVERFEESAAFASAAGLEDMAVALRRHAETLAKRA